MNLSLAVARLRPNAEFVIYNDNLEGLIFIKPETATKPTMSECEAAWAEIVAEKEAAEAKAIADKANALAKLAALGLTDDELKAVIGS